MPNLSAEQKKMATALGIDFSKLDVGTILKAIQLLTQLLGGGLMQSSNPATVMQSIGCKEDRYDECAASMQAGLLALQSAQISLSHCNDCCK